MGHSVFQSIKDAQGSVAKMKNSEANHPKALYTVCYPSYVVNKPIGSKTFKSLASACYLLQTFRRNELYFKAIQVFKVHWLKRIGLTQMQLE